MRCGGEKNRQPPHPIDEAVDRSSDMQDAAGFPECFCQVAAEGLPAEEVAGDKEEVLLLARTWCAADDIWVSYGWIWCVRHL